MQYSISMGLIVPSVVAALFALLVSTASAQCICDVTEYGAVGDGNQYEDEAFSAALAACINGGRVNVPSGRYLLSPFNLTSNIELHLDNGAVLLPTTDFNKWPTIAQFPSYPDDGITIFSAFIGGSGVANASITGMGMIDGQGKAWWDAADNHEVDNHGRPRLIEPTFCSNFTLRGIRIVDPPYWAVHPYACDGVLVENVSIQAPVTSANTDGIDPDSCSSVVIRNYSATCGDDAIAIKSGKDEEGRAFNRPSHDILIEGGVIGPSSSINIGSEMSGGVYNVVVRGVTFRGGLFSSRIKSARGRGGFVRNVTYEDLTLESCAMGPAINMQYSGRDDPPLSPMDEGTPRISDIHYRSHTGRAVAAGAFFCLPESPCQRITLEDMNISSVTKFECMFAHGETHGYVYPESCLS